MADVIINFVANSEQLKPAESAFDSLIAKDKDLGEEAKRTSAIYQERTKQITAGSSAVAKSLAGIAAGMKDSDKAIIGGKALQDIKALQTALQITSKELKGFYEGIRNNARVNILAGGTVQQLEQFEAELTAATQLLKELEQAEQSTTKTSVSLRTQLRNVKDELADMAAKGLQATPAFKELQKRGGELTDDIGDLSATLQGLGSDTRVFDGLISAASGIAGGFALAQGAVALFGDESEEVQQALLKLNAVMAILQGLQQIQQVLQKESAAALLLTDIRTKALALSQGELAATTLSTTAATIALRTALLAVGGGAIIGIIALVGYLSSLSDATHESVESTKEFREELASTSKEVFEAQNKLAVLQERVKNAGNSFAEKEAILKDYNREFGDTIGKATSINQLERILIERAPEYIRILGLKARAQAATNLALKEQEKQLQAELDLREKSKDLVANPFTIRDVVQPNARAISINNLADQVKESNDKIAELNSIAAQAETEADAASSAGHFKTEEEKTEKTRTETTKRKAIAARNAQALYEIKKRGIERLIELDTQNVNDDSSGAAAQLLFLKDLYSEQLNLIELSRQNELRVIGLTNDEKANINSKYALESLRATEDFEKKKSQIVSNAGQKDKTEQAALLQDLLDRQLNQYSKFIDEIKLRFQNIFKLNDSEQDSELDQLTTKYLNGAIKFEEYQKALDEIEYRYSRRRLSNEVAAIELNIDASKKAGKSTEDLEAQLLQKKDAIRKLDVANHAKAETDKTKKTDEETLKRAEVERQIVQGGFDLLRQAADAVFSTNKAQRDADLQDALQSIVAARDAELNNKNLTEQQKSDINKRYQEKERQTKIKAFLADKEAAKQQAIINGFLAVTNALATVRPFVPAALIAAGVAAASAAIQVAAIAAQPIPRFKHGKVGIEGPGTATSDSIHAMISRGESVINARQTEKYKGLLEAINADKPLMPSILKMPDFQFPHVPQQVYNQQRGGGSAAAIDYDKLGKAIAANMPKMPNMEFIIEDGRIKGMVKDAAGITEYKNRRWSL